MPPTDANVEDLHAMLAPDKTHVGLAKKFTLYTILVVAVIGASIGLYYLAYRFEATASYYEPIDYPYYDTNTYRALTLSNGMKLLLVSNTKAQMATAALSVGVGSFADPTNLEGLANLCQHLANMGSSKYPGADTFASYLSNHSGIYEAYTDLEKSVFSFQVGISGLEQSLDMLANMFVEPVFTEADIGNASSLITKELTKTYDNTQTRLHYVLQLLASSDHPYSRFSSGNNDTLVTNPSTLGLDVLTEAQAFFETYYSSNIMYGVVVSNDTLDTLENWTKTYFEVIPDRGAETLSYSNYTNPFTTNKRTYTQFDPAQGENYLYLVFYTISLDKYYPEKPFEYLRSHIEERGQSSLYEYLKNNSYVTDIKMTVETNATFGSIVQVRFSLTQTGLDYIDEIPKAFFAYINLISEDGISQDIWDDIAEEAELSYNYTERGYDLELRYAQRLVTNLAKYGEKEVLTGEYLFSNYDSNLLKTFIGSFSIDNCLILICSPQFSVSTNLTVVSTETSTVTLFQMTPNKLMKGRSTSSSLFKSHHKMSVLSEMTEDTTTNTTDTTTNLTDTNSTTSNTTNGTGAYLSFGALVSYSEEYNVDYLTQTIPEDYATILQNIAAEDYPQIALRESNPYFPTSLQMYCSVISTTGCDTEFEKDALEYWPSDITTYLDYGHVWYQLERSFRTPRYIMSLIMHSPYVYQSAEDQFKFLVYCRYLDDVIQPQYSLQAHAGYWLTISCGFDYLEIKFDGFSDNLQQVIVNITTSIKDLTYDEDRFVLVRDLFIEALNETQSDPLYVKAPLRVQNLLLSYNYNTTELLETGASLTYSDWSDFLSQMNSFYLDTIIIGNLKQTNANTLATEIIDKLDLNRISEDSLLVNEVSNLAGRSVVFREFSSSNSTAENLTLNYYFTGPMTAELTAKLTVLEAFISGPARTYLQDDWELGNYTSAEILSVGNYSGIAITVQSGTYDPSDLDKEIESFLTSFETYFTAMSKSNFELYRSQIALDASLNPQTLGDKAEGYAAKVRDRSYDFNFTHNVSEIIPTLAKADILDFFQELFGNTSSRLSYQVYYRQNDTMTLPTTVLSANQTYSGLAETLLTDETEIWGTTTENNEETSEETSEASNQEE